MDSSATISGVQAAVLLLGLTYAAWVDWRTREVNDALWIVLALLGIGLGLYIAVPEGWLSTVLWIVVGLFVLEHLIPWDLRFERDHPSWPGIIEIAAYAGVTALVIFALARFGVGSNGVPVQVLAVYVGVLLARGLFEARLLFGGADAKALMVAGIIVPIFAFPLIPPPASVAGFLGISPFPLTVLINATLFTLVIPLSIAILNLRRGEFEFRRGFTGYTIPVAELPERYVWLRDPTYGPPLTDEGKEVETSEDDRKLREKQRAALEQAGVQRVWVTPQLPFVVILALGAYAGILLGNLFFNLLVLL